MTLRARLLFVFILILISVSAFAQGQWTLQQCIDRALQYNIQIKLSDLNVQNSDISVQQNMGAIFPSLNGSASQNYFYGRSIDPYTNTYTTSQVRGNNFSLNSSVTLFDGFQLQNTLKQSKLTYLSSQNDLKKMQNDISLNVVTYYLQVLYNQELLDITTSQVAATDTQRYRTKRMYELGSVAKGNFLDLESQYASDEVRLIQAQSNLDQSMLSLTQLLELDTVKSFSITNPDVKIPEFVVDQANVEVVYGKALTTQPDIKSSEQKLLASEKGLAVARGGRSPRLYLSGSLSTNYSTSSKTITGYNEGPPTRAISGFTSSGDTVYSFIPNSSPIIQNTPFHKQFNDNLGKSVGFTLQVPFFNGLSVSSNIRRSKLNLEQARLNLDQNKKTLYKSVQQAVADALSSYRKYVAGQRSVDALEESYRYNKQRFESGLINTYDFLQSKTNYVKAQADLVQAKYDYIFRLKILDFYQGKPLTF